MNPSFVDKLTTKYPTLLLKKHTDFHWSPSEGIVYYDSTNSTQEGAWALLHESGHALLDHTTYRSDFELLQLEVAAWEKAKEIAVELQNDERRTANGGKNRTAQKSAAAPRHSFIIDEDHTQDCLDSYRNWLHKRSLCPDCSLSGVQTSSDTYSCIFCHKHWGVTAERFCRPYRRST